jgi:hypothetical protein
MQLVSYRPHSLFLSHSSCITLAVQEELDVAQLASHLAYFISPDFFPVPPFLSIYRTSYHALSGTFTHTYYPYFLIPPLSSNVLCRLELVLEIKTLTEKIFHAQEGGEVRSWCARWPCSLRNGNARWGWIKYSG